MNDHDRGVADAASAERPGTSPHAEVPQEKERAVADERARTAPAPDPVKPQRPLNCAFIDLDRVPEGALLETRLLQNTKVNWVERNHIDQVLREQELQALLSPEGGRQRVRLGKLLKADVLVMLRSVTVEKTKVLELVVCETRQGLRLSVQSIPITNNADEGVAALAGHVERSLARRGKRITDICAVPPFVNNDLGYEFDYLKSTFAKLIEQMVLEREELLTVELAEAKEIAREVALVDGGTRVERRLPLYFLGEYRHEGQGQERRLTIRIQLMRGEQQLGRTVKADLRPEDAAGFVRQAVAELLDKAGSAKSSPIDTAVEAKQLAERAATFQKLGNWDEAIALMEASLLLKPDQDELRRQAVIVLGKLSRHPFERGGELTLDQVQRGAAYYFRGLEFLEIFLERVGDLSAYREIGRPDFVYEFLRSTSWVASGRPGQEVIAALVAVRERQRDVLLRIVRMRAYAGRGDEHQFMAVAVRQMPAREKFALLLRMIRELKDLPGAGTRAKEFATLNLSITTLDCPEGQDFLDQLALVENTETQQQAASLKKSFEAYQRSKLMPVPRRPPPSPGPAHIIFHPIELIKEEPNDGKAVKLPWTVNGGCFPAGKDVDVIWSDWFIGLMKEKGKVKFIKTPPFKGQFGRLCFDGRYIWAPTHSYNGHAPRLLIADPVSEEVWQVTAEDGLPFQDLPNESQFLFAAPIAPGKVCLAGFFGRTWLALVSFDPKTGKKVKIFHEAREKPNPEDMQQWQSTTVAFAPTFMVTIAGKPDLQGKTAQRILVGRSCNHPLLIDPEKLSMEVIRDRIECGDLIGSYCDAPWMSVHDDAVYWVWLSQSGGHGVSPTLWRLGFPDFTKKAISQKLHARAEHAESVGGNKVVFHGGRVHVVSKRWMLADAPDKPFFRLRGDIPERFDIRSYLAKPAHLRDNRESEYIHRIGHSNHYGLLAFTKCDLGGFIYQIEFPNLPDAKKP